MPHSSSSSCSGFFLFLLFLSFCFLSTSTLANARHHRPHPYTVVDIRNDLPNTTHVQLSLSCDQGPSSNLKLGHYYNRTLQVDHNFECSAMWLPWFTTWDAYKAKTDKHHQTIHWSVRKHGFYRSFDGSKWKLQELWYTE